MKRIQRIVPCATVLLLALSAASPRAGLIVNDNAAWPATTYLQTFDRTDVNVEAERDARFTRNLAQTFQAGTAFKLDKIYIDYEEGIVGKEMTIRLFTVPNVNGTTLAQPGDAAFTGTVLFSHTYVTSEFIITSDGGNNPLGVMEFDFTEADEITIPATTGTAGYAFQIVRSGAGSELDATGERAFKWHFNDNDNRYPGGRSFAITGGGVDANDDFLFAIVESTTDTDGDGMPDAYEDANAFDKAVAADAALDADTDGLTNLQEYQKRTLPRNPDTDADGLNDGVETGTGTFVSAADTGTDPLKLDTDGDMLADGAETGTNTYVSPSNTGTSPVARDSDADRVPDGAELSAGTNPTDVASVGSFPATGLNLFAYWDFNDATASTQVVDRVNNFLGIFENGAVYTADAGGRSGQAGDRGVNFGNASVAGRSVHIPAGINPTNITGKLSSASVTDVLSVSWWQKWNGPIANSSAIWIVSPSTTTGGSRGYQSHTPYGNSIVYFDTGGDGVGNYNRISANISTFGDPAFDWTQWRHITLVKNHEVKQIWIDGKLFLGGTGLPLPGDLIEMYLGMDFSANANTARIIMDDVAMFASALDEPKIIALKGGASPLNLEAAAGDDDSDGLPNFWEDLYGLNKASNADAALDGDSDGLTNLQEFAAKTIPNNADTDGDGLKDGVETNTGSWTSATNTGTDPLKADTDRDGINDGAETKTGTYVSPTDTGTDPTVADSDGDLFSDGVEVALGSNPNSGTLTPIVAGQRNLIAFWDFNDATAPTQSSDRVHSFTGNLTAGAVFTADAAGRTTTAGDRGIDMGTTTVAGRGFRVPNTYWLNAVSPGDSMTVSYWQKWNVAIANSSAFWFFSPSAANGNRGAHAETPFGDGNIPWDTGGTTVGSQRIQANFSTFTNVTTLSFFTNWHHFAFVKNFDTKQIWIDGRLFLEGAGANPLVSDFTDIYLGVEPTGANNLRGILDDFAVFATALSAEDIGKLAQGLSPLTFEAPAPPLKISAVTYTGGVFTITWDSAPGKQYRVVTSPSVPATSWTQVATVPSGGATTSYSPAISSSPGMSFYQVEVLP